MNRFEFGSYEYASWQLYVMHHNEWRVPEMEGVVPRGWVIDGRYVDIHPSFFRQIQAPVLPLKPIARTDHDMDGALAMLAHVKMALACEHKKAKLVLVPHVVGGSLEMLVGMLRLEMDAYVHPENLILQFTEALHENKPMVARSLDLMHLARTGVRIAVPDDVYGQDGPDVVDSWWADDSDIGQTRFLP